ncbi:MAG: hypothetical protein PWP71_2345 [Clostridia bacterium]|nr:hypothetical protein [Clostridia bacterium]
MNVKYINSFLIIFDTQEELLIIIGVTGEMNGKVILKSAKKSKLLVVPIKISDEIKITVNISTERKAA